MDVVCILWLSVFVMITFQGGHHALSEDRESNRHSRQKVTVQSGELKPCKDNDHLCVTDSSDCIPESSVIQGEVKNISCFYQRNDESITCSWNSLNNYNGDIEYTLFFSSVRTMYDCPSIFNLAAVFNVTVRARSNKKTTLALSDPCVLDLCAAERPSRPNITSISSMTKNSLHVKWTTDKLNFNATVQCKIRYKVTTAAQWTQVMDNSIVDQRGVYTIEDLQPFSSYRVAVSCTGGCGQKHWSDWSTERLGSTPETAPSKPLNVCQHIEPLNSEGKRSLWLMWKALDVSDTHGNILGYQVHYVPPNQLSLGRTVNTTDMGIWLSLIDEEYDVRVMAYNGAGGSPYTYCKITNDLQNLPPVEGVWANLKGNSLWVVWEAGDGPLSVSEFAIQWAPEGDSRSSRWQWVSHSTYRTVLRGDIQPLKRYNVTVYPIYGRFCGPPKSVLASLEHEVPGDTGKLRILKLTKYTAEIQWEWQRKWNGNSFLRYRVILTSGREMKTVEVRSDIEQYAFTRLTPNTDYSVCVIGETVIGNYTSQKFLFTTLLLDKEEIISAVSMILLVILLMALFFILSTTVYREYFFPIIPNPSVSPIGQWLLEYKHENVGTEVVLKLQDFSVMEILTESSSIQMGKLELPIHTEQEENSFCLGGSELMEDKLPHKFVQNAPLSKMADYIENTPLSITAEYVDNVPLSKTTDYVESAPFSTTPERLENTLPKISDYLGHATFSITTETTENTPVLETSEYIGNQKQLS